MALKTILAQLSLVLDNKVPVIKSMAFTAGPRVKFMQAARMAAFTIEGCTRIIQFVLYQTKACLDIVVKVLSF